MLYHHSSMCCLVKNHNILCTFTWRMTNFTWMHCGYCFETSLCQCGSNVRQSVPSGGRCLGDLQRLGVCLGCYKDGLLRTRMGEDVLHIFLTSWVTSDIICVYFWLIITACAAHFDKLNWCHIFTAYAAHADLVSQLYNTDTIKPNWKFGTQCCNSRI